MLNKTFFTAFACLALSTAPAMASETQQIRADIKNLQREVKKLWIQRNKLRREVGSLEDKVDGDLSDKSEFIDSVNNRQKGLIEDLETFKDGVKKDLVYFQKAHESYQSETVQLDEKLSKVVLQVDSIQQKKVERYVPLTIAVLFLILLLLAYVRFQGKLKKAEQAQIEIRSQFETKLNAMQSELMLRLSQDAERLNALIKPSSNRETAPIDLDKKIAEVLAAHLEKTPIQVSVQEKESGQNVEPDHSLIKALADRITFMQTTLFRMDPKTRGYRQLKKALEQMNNNLLANGYEIVAMVGLPYSDGMKAITTFVDDDSLDEGQRIISNVTKPQINYNGVMIQTAQITVSQNV